MAASNNNNKTTQKQQSIPEKNAPNIRRSFGERRKKKKTKTKKANAERCDCTTLAKNQSLGKVIAFSGEEERGVDLTHTTPTAPLPPALSSLVPKLSLPDWGCSRRAARGGTLGPQRLCPGWWPGPGKGKRVRRKVREGEGEGSGRWGEGLLRGMQGCVRALQGGELGSRGAECGQTGRQLSREVMKRRGLKMKRCRSRHGTSSSHNVPELAGVNGL